MCIFEAFICFCLDIKAMEASKCANTISAGLLAV